MAKKASLKKQFALYQTFMQDEEANSDYKHTMQNIFDVESEETELISRSGVASNRCDILGGWIEADAAGAIKAGDSSKWGQMVRALEFKYAGTYHDWLAEHIKKKWRHGQFLKDRVANHLMTALAYKHWDKADLLAHWLEYSKTTEKGIRTWKNTYHMHYAVTLWRYLHGRQEWVDVPVDPKSNCEDVYSTIFEHWEDTEFIRQHAVRVLDYHLERAWDSARFSAEYIWPAVDVLPIEIWAMNSVREELGLQVVANIEHEMAAPPFDAPPLPIEFDVSSDPHLVKTWEYLHAFQAEIEEKLGRQLTIDILGDNK